MEGTERVNVNGEDRRGSLVHGDGRLWSSRNALDVLSGIAGEFLMNVGRTVRFYLDARGWFGLCFNEGEATAMLEDEGDGDPTSS